MAKKLATLPNRTEVLDALKGTTLRAQVQQAQNEAPCEKPGPFREGVAQLRISATKTKVQAEQKRKAAATLFADKGLQEWVKWLDVFSAGLGHEKVWVVVLNKVQPNERNPVCKWLQCNGWDTGLLKCDLR